MTPLPRYPTTSLFYFLNMYKLIKLWNFRSSCDSARIFFDDRVSLLSKFEMRVVGDMVVSNAKLNRRSHNMYVIGMDEVNV